MNATLPADVDAGPRTLPPESGPRFTLWLLRALALLYLVAVLVQPVLAGLYLSGEWDALGVHSANAVLVESLGFVMFLAAVLYWLAGRGRGGVPLVCALIWFATSMQAGFGYARMLALHIPLGVTVVLGAVLFAFWVFRPGARRPRRAWRRAR